MCDYSLAVVPNRLAVEGEELVAHRFHTGSIGFAPAADLHAAQRSLKPAPQKSFWQTLKTLFEDPRHFPNVPAVCIPPGARLLLKNIPEDLQRQWRVEERESVLFVQVSAAENTYRDAIQFRHGGPPVRLQDLRDGVVAQVLSLDSMQVADEPDLAARLF